MVVPSVTFALTEWGECRGGFHHARVKVFSCGHGLYWQSLHSSVVTEADMVPTQKVGERERNRRTWSNFIWGQILQDFGRGVPALLGILRTRAARSPTPSVPPSALAALQEPYVMVISEELHCFDFWYLLLIIWGKYCPKCNCLYIIIIF